jgi:hypothetical protein
VANDQRIALAEARLYLVAPAHAQTATGQAGGYLRGVGTAQPCLFVRGGTLCDPFGTFNTSNGAFTANGVGIDTETAAQSITMTPYAGNVPRTTSLALRACPS